VLLLESLVHSRELKSSLKNKNQDLDLRKREKRAQSLDIKEAFWFSEWPTALGGRWGLFIAPTLKRAIGELFTEQVW
jgi:hypothetical protein